MPRPSIKTLADLIAILNVVLTNESERASALKDFQMFVFDASAPISGSSEAQWEIINNLAFDLDYYEPKVLLRNEDPSFYDDRRLANEVKIALQKIEDLNCE